MISSFLKSEIIKYSEKYRLPPEIVYGIVQVESSFNQQATRYEPNYRWLYHPERFVSAHHSIHTEIEGQKTSYGLMQVMGAVLRELGYSGYFPGILDHYEVQLEYGCRYLKKLINKHGVEGGVEAYNAGHPLPGKSEYYQKVIKAAKGF